MLLLRDVLARSLFAKYQDDFEKLNRILDAYEPAANRIANTVAVGIAIGAYGIPALRWLVHLPAEWTALGLSLATYLAGRDQRLSAAHVGQALTVLLPFTAVTALLETNVTPQG